MIQCISSSTYKGSGGSGKKKKKSKSNRERSKSASDQVAKISAKVTKMAKSASSSSLDAVAAGKEAVVEKANEVKCLLMRGER